MAPWPNRVAQSRFSFRGTDYTLPENDGPHALHGLAADRPWEVLANTGRACELAISFDERWPWQGRAWQRIELLQGALRLKLEVRSAQQPFPAGCGWHPSFRRSALGANDVHVTVPAERVYQRVGHIPTGAVIPAAGGLVLDGSTALGSLAIDDCFTSLRGAPILRWGRRSLTVEFSAAAPHLQVFATPNSICLEPQTCAPDAFNLAANGRSGTGFAIAEPGRPASISSTWRWASNP